MSTYNDDNFDNFDDDGPPEESNNRTFLLAAGGLGLLVLLALLCLGGYLLFNNNRTNQANATVLAQNTQQMATVQAGGTQAFLVQAQTLTAAVTPTLPPTNTPVVAQATATVSPTQNPATVTLAAAFTQVAVSTSTIIATSTALPRTGFADEVGLPGMLMMGVALIGIIFLVRRLRAAPTR